MCIQICILQSPFSSPEQLLCRDNALSLMSLGKISLSHILFAIVKELLGSGPTLVFHGKRTVKRKSSLLSLTG